MTQIGENKTHYLAHLIAQVRFKDWSQVKVILQGQRNRSFAMHDNQSKGIKNNRLVTWMDNGDLASQRNLSAGSGSQKTTATHATTTTANHHHICHPPPTNLNPPPTITTTYHHHHHQPPLPPTTNTHHHNTNKIEMLQRSMGYK
ncbi:hypothetical protein DPMN_019150 [Dreissena polymorpha]|uniref:Uncharacterized protein n=1 Tax=Dreissena polymorpha TaxID=45954 RepID=A0A9D4S909_DREPO|nr:hypothetical protein DPMN_019150 [Dreissena polymorpha]